MLELLQKVDQSRDDGPAKHFGSPDYKALARAPESEAAEHGTQGYSQSSASQGFGLRLAPPSQRLPNSSHFLSSHGLPLTGSVQGLKELYPELKENTQMLSPSHESSQRANWNDKASGLGSGNSSGLGSGNSVYLNMLGNSMAAYAPNSTYSRNQSQMQVLSSGSGVSQPLQATLASRLPQFNHVASPDASQQISSNPLSQQFPVLEAAPVSQPLVISDMSQQGEASTRQHNVWRNVPVQRQPSVQEPPKVPYNLSSAPGSSNVNIINNLKVGHVSDVGGAGLLQQHLPSEVPGASQMAALLHGPKPLSKENLDANELNSGSFGANSNQQELSGMKNDYSNSPTVSHRNLTSVAHSFEASPNQNYSLLDQVQAMKGVETDPSKRMAQQMHGNNFRSGSPADGERTSGVELNSVASMDPKAMNLSKESVEDLSARASARSGLPERTSNESVRFGQSEFHSQSGTSNFISHASEQNQVNLHMAPSWFKQYGTLKNGQMLPMYDARLANAVSAQFFLGKTSQNLHSQTSFDGLNATDSRQGTVLPMTVPNLVGAEHVPAPYVLPTDVTNSNMAVTNIKKRKRAALERLPWHKEVVQGSDRLQDIRYIIYCVTLYFHLCCLFWQ